MSPRVLWGEQEVTRLRPDGEGGFFVESSPRFTAEDVRLFEAAREAEASISPRGLPVDVEFDPANQGRFRVGDEQGLPSKNFAVDAQVRARKAYEKAWPDTDVSSLVWPVRLVT